jgi:hypothetical protein
MSDIKYRCAFYYRPFKWDNINIVIFGTGSYK